MEPVSSSDLRLGASLLQLDENCRIELSIIEPLPGFFPPDYDNRLDLVSVQFVFVIQDRWSASPVGHSNDRRLLVDLDRQPHSGRRQSPMFDEHHRMVHLV